MAQELPSFKAGELQKKNAAQAAPAKAKTEEKTSAGFPRVEALIDEYPSAAEAKDVLTESLSQLSGLLAKEKNVKKKAELVKAKRAFELTLEMVDYLFKVKSELTKAAALEQGGPAKK